MGGTFSHKPMDVHNDYLPYLRFNIRKFKINNYPGARYLMDYPLGFAYGPDATITALAMQGQIGGIDLQYSLGSTITSSKVK